MEMSKDADGRIISYRDSDGKLYENVGLETPIVDTETLNTKTVSADSLTLSKVGLNEFEQALREAEDVIEANNIPASLDLANIQKLHELILARRKDWRQ